MSDRCPECRGAARVVTAVTVPALGDAPRHVLVTRQCIAGTCQLKFLVFKVEPALTEEERALWRRR